MAMPPASLVAPEAAPEVLVITDHPITPEELHQLDNLRNLRAEVVDLQTSLHEVRKGQADLNYYDVYIQNTLIDIQELIDSIHEEFARGGKDNIRQIKNAWEQMRTSPILSPQQANLTTLEVLKNLDLLDDQINRIIFLVGYATIPSRINNWLSKSKPGYYLPFDLVFEDEVPNKHDRDRIFNYLTWSPKAIHNGIIDAPAGLIYRTAIELRDQIISAVVVLLVLIILTLIVAQAGNIKIAEWPLKASDQATLLICWGATLAGILVHDAVGNVKRNQSRGSLPPVIAVGDFFPLINARLGQIILRIFLALIGFGTYVFGFGMTEVTPFNAFLVGYSLDSVLELFDASMEQRATSQVESMKKQMGVK